jgi:cob(I)alamin adenosyltransferase
MKIYTGTGDEDETGLFDGTRVSKAAPRVQAYGDIDELNALFGVALAGGPDAELAEMLVQLQRDLFALGSRLADPSHRIAARVEKAGFGADDVRRLEGWIDRLDGGLPPLRRFILPGGTTVGALLHLARTVCRRAERRIVELGPDAVERDVLMFVNRLSDLLFVMARAANQRAGVQESEW